MSSSLPDLYRDNPVTSLNSLKKKIDEQRCEKCDRAAIDWSVINVCDHVLCRRCLHVERLRSKRAVLHQCPICKRIFDLNENVVSKTKIKSVCSEMEDFLLKVTALENGPLDVDAVDP